MNRLTITLTPNNDKRLRELNRKKGDLSNYINYALEQYFADIDHDNQALKCAHCGKIFTETTTDKEVINHLRTCKENKTQ
jgi:3-methyladenine DNA glycosylase Tag